MKRKLLSALVALVSLSLPALADEGMWLMQQLQSQMPKMQKLGLKLQDYDIYNEQGSSLRDAIVVFGNGCTGEVISQQGLVLTNHHCGYSSIQGLSSVEHNYLEQGFWAQSFAEELPAKGLKVTFIDKIEDVTDFVRAELKKSKQPEVDRISPLYLASLAQQRAKTTALTPGMELEIKAFYEGNRYLLFTKKVYSDIRFVGAPPTSIGSFGADTDNWTYPRHSGDFALFRIYADANGNPAPYSALNQPLKPKRWLNISTGGVQENQFVMIMGFPGRTNRFFLPEEVEEWKSIDNDIRIRMRAIRQEAMLQEMLRDTKTKIQYASKYAYSQNGYKRAIGANWGVEVRQLAQDKEAQLNGLLASAQGSDKTSYEHAIASLRSALAQRATLRRRLSYLQEGMLTGMEFIELPALAKKSGVAQEAFYKDYSPEVDKKVSLALLTEYLAQIPSTERPRDIDSLLNHFGSAEALIDLIFRSQYLKPEGLKKLAEEHKAAKAAKRQPIYENIAYGSLRVEPDRVLEQFTDAVHKEYKKLSDASSAYDKQINQARHTYVGGLLKKEGDSKLWPDANFTLRFTYGQIKGYHPRDGVYYAPQTYLDGVMAKEDSLSWEFTVPTRLKEIYKSQRYGKNNRWAVRHGNSWRMPVNLCATTHTTGGNSGSPVLDAEGNLVGINFDRNWEGVAGDIQYLGDYQRSIICDIRYIMMIIDEYGQCPRLIDEMSFGK